MVSKKVNAVFFGILVSISNWTLAADSGLKLKYDFGAGVTECSSVESLQYNVASKTYDVKNAVCSPSSSSVTDLQIPNKPSIGTLNYTQGNAPIVQFSVVNVVVDNNSTLFELQKAAPTTFVPNTTPSPTPVSQDTCNVSGISDVSSGVFPCASNPNLFIINPHDAQETSLPGCAGVVTGNIQTCRLTKSMQGEAYAIRFNFKNVADKYKDSSFSIQGWTTDSMRLDSPRFSRFDVAVSTIPGDFTGNNRPACTRNPTNSGPDGSIRAVQYNKDSPSYDCELTPNTSYYINVKATEEGCHNKQTNPRDPDQSEYPAHGCNISIITQIPPSQ